MGESNNKKPSIPLLPSLGKKYSNFEAYLHSRISKNHYLYNDKIINQKSTQTQTVNSSGNSQEANILDGVIQCKSFFENPQNASNTFEASCLFQSNQFESMSKFSMASSKDSNNFLRQNNSLNINKNFYYNDAINNSGLISESFSLNLKQTNKQTRKMPVITSNNKDQLNHMEMDKQINKIINKHNNKPLKNYISSEEKIKNSNNNNNSNAISEAANISSLITNNNNNELNKDFKNLINQLDLPSNMLILSGKNYLNNCQVNPNINNKKDLHNLQENYIEQHENKLQQPDKQEKEITEQENIESLFSDNYSNKQLEEIELNKRKLNLNVNISEIPLEILYTQNNCNNTNGDENRAKIVLDLKNALRSYCFKYSKKRKSLENFNAKIRNFNRIQMTKRRNEKKSAKKKLENNNIELKLANNNNNNNNIKKRNSITDSVDSFPENKQQLIIEDDCCEENEEEAYEDIEEDIEEEIEMNEADQEEEEDFENNYLNYQYNFDRQVEDYEQDVYEQDCIEEILNNNNNSNSNNDLEVDETEQEMILRQNIIKHTNNETLTQKKSNEPKLSKINIEFINRFRKSSNKLKKKHPISSKHQEQQKQQQQQQQTSLISNEEINQHSDQQLQNNSNLQPLLKIKNNILNNDSSNNTDYENSIDASSSYVVDTSKQNKSKKVKIRNLQENVTEIDELASLSNKTKVKNKSKKNENKLLKNKTIQVRVQTSSSLSSSSSSYSTSAKSENKLTKKINNHQEKQQQQQQQQQFQEINLKENKDLNRNFNNNEQTEHNRKHFELVSNEINFRNNKLESENNNYNNNNNENILNEEFACILSTNQTTILSNLNQEQSNDLNNSLDNSNSNNSFHNNNNNTTTNTNNYNNIKHVFEKTRLLVRNFYKNFDLLKETQDLSEQIVSSKMYSAAAAAAAVQQQHHKLTTKQQSLNSLNSNRLLTNSTSNLLINTTIGISNQQPQQQQQQSSPIAATTLLQQQQQQQQPHWVNIATMGNSKTTASSLNNKVFSGGSNANEPIYLYSEMPLANGKNSSTKILGQLNRNSSKMFLNHFKNGLNSNVEDSLAVSPVRTIASSKHTGTNNQNKQIILLKRDKAGKLIPIEATTTTSFKSQHTNASIKNTEEAYINDSFANSEANLGDLGSNLNDYLKLPNLMKTKLTLEQLNKQQQQQQLSSSLNQNAASNNANFVLTQMTKYQRQNAINFLKLTSKTSLANGIDAARLSVSSTNNNNINYNRAQLINSTEQTNKQSLSPSTSPPLVPPSTAPTQQQMQQQQPILIRGNSFTATKEISNQLLNQQQLIINNSALQPNQNLIRPKLSQIKLKNSKNRPIIITNMADYATAESLAPINIETHGDFLKNNIDQTIEQNDRVKSDIQTALLNNTDQDKEEKIQEQIILPSISPSNSENNHVKKKHNVLNNHKKISLLDIEPTLNKCRGLYTHAATSSSQLKDAAFFSNNMNNTRTHINYLNYNTDAFLSNSTEDILTSLLNQKQQKHQQQQTPEQAIHKKASNHKSKKELINEIMNPIKIKNTSNNRQIFKDLEFIYNEQQVIKLQRQILIQIRQQNKLNKQETLQTEPQPQNIKEDLAEDDEFEENITATSNNPDDLKPKQQIEQSNNFSRNAGNFGQYNYDYDVYKFYERNKTSLLLNSLQQQLKNKAKSTNMAINKQIIKSTINLNDINSNNINSNNVSSNHNNNTTNNNNNNNEEDDYDEELDEEEEEELERDDAESDEIFETTNLITKCES